MCSLNTDTVSDKRTNWRKCTCDNCTSYYDKPKREKWEEWSHYVAGRIHLLLDGENPLPAKQKRWKVSVRELVHVKSYAPHVDHLVADLECRPVDV